MTASTQVPYMYSTQRRTFLSKASQHRCLSHHWAVEQRLILLLPSTTIFVVDSDSHCIFPIQQLLPNCISHVF